jgi:hypothetical protein
MKNKVRASIGTTPNKKNDKSPSGQIWPNGEFGLGYYCDYEETTFQDEYNYVLARPSDSGVKLTPEEASALTLSDVSNSRKHGLKGLTTHGARMVRSGCYLLESRLGRSDCMMWTLTVPTLSREGRVELAGNWGKLVNRTVEWISRKLARAGRPPAIIGCTEIQTGRLEKYRQGYLHLHLICPAHSNNGGRFALDVVEFRTWWKEALERFSGRTIPTLPRIQAEVVRKSAEGYMGKYLSKGSGEELAGFIEDLGADSVPGQWWFCSALMRDRVKKGRRQGRNTGAVLEAFIQNAFETGQMDIFEYISHVDLVTETGRYTCGWYGKLRRDVADELIAFLSPLGEC